MTVVAYASSSSKTAIIAAAAVVGVAASAYLIYKFNHSSKTMSSTTRKKSKRGKVVKQEQPPLQMEEMEYSQAEQQQSIKEQTEATATPAPVQLSSNDRLALSKEAKAKGNSLYSAKKYDLAIEEYTRAIDYMPDAVYYSNRAACYSNLDNHQKVVDDCTLALQLNPTYIKAITRRALAHEQLGNLTESLIDLTTVCVLEEFRVESSMTATDRILKKLGEQKAKEIMKTKVHKLPSLTFVRAYMESFSSTSINLKKKDSVLAQLPSTPQDELVITAYKHIQNHMYAESEEAIVAALATNNGDDDEITASPSLSSEFAHLAYELRGTYEFLKGNVDKAISDFQKAIKLNSSNMDAVIKMASTHMERGGYPQALQEYSEAVVKSSSSSASPNPDIYYHRGQARHITGDIVGAIEDFRECIKICPEFLYSHIQLAVALYKQSSMMAGGNPGSGMFGNGNSVAASPVAEAGIKEAIAVFENAKLIFKERMEVDLYMGEILMDMGKTDDAIECFDSASKMDPTSALPYVNKAILFVQSKNDPITAEEYFKKAMEIDPLGDVVYGPLAQLYLTLNRVEEAISVYDKAIEIARSEAELVTAISCREAAAAQVLIAKRFPDIMKKLSN